ncbi:MULTISPECIES: hypothetical protein [unclassified Crossiella]|uniref:hypothetical protein n=1 Tax=Crossiella sp. CA-258035 TaxID=2981138 RepID=UPI0024BC00C4|nr:hypothetical protein [Crossiella sp. CA-258035]WHT20647.1 hypothetical protein N8J89_06135 [Crossiella sp. CA-258035]
MDMILFHGDECGRLSMHDAPPSQDKRISSGKVNTMAILDLQGLDTNAAELTMTGSTVSNGC